MRKSFPLSGLIFAAIGGAVAATAIGFTWGGWVTGSKAKLAAEEQAKAAIVSVLAPICVGNFNRDGNAEANRLGLKNTSTWERDAFVRKGGWAKTEGTEAPSTGVLEACAERILAAKS